MTGLSPREFAEAARMKQFKKLLREGLTIAEALSPAVLGLPAAFTNEQIRIWG